MEVVNIIKNNDLCFIRYIDGTIYIGNFLNIEGKTIPDEIGKLIFSSGESYEGDFSEGKINGVGKYVNSVDNEYLGEWSENMQNGYGIETLGDIKFEGKFLNGKKLLGKMYWNDGSSYYGEFNNNSFNGFVRIFNFQGYYYSNDDKKFIGIWSNGNLNEYCEIISKDGKIYIGTCKKDKKDGFGIYYTSNPTKIYLGCWKDNKYNGVGKLISEKSSKYGLWNQGEKMKWYANYQDAFNSLGIDYIKYKDLLYLEHKDISIWIDNVLNF